MRAGAAGLYCAAAAVELLIGHGRWLHRDEFIAAFVEVVPALGDGAPLAFVDWPRAAAHLGRGHLACSSGEGQDGGALGRGEGVPVDLAEALTSLDAPTVMLAACAMLHASGCPEAAHALRNGDMR